MERNYLRKTGVVLASIMLFATLTACGNKAAESETSSQPQTDANATQTDSATALTVSGMIDPAYSDRDLDGTWDADAAVAITLSDNGSTVSGAGATVSNSMVTINSAGTYVVNGSLTNGQIIVEAANTDKVQIVLNGVNITCESSAPIFVKQADKVFLTLAEGSTNTVTDGANYVLDANEEPNGAVFSKDDLTINGSGTLVVTANYNNGIVSKDDLYITGGTITVSAPNHGLKGKDAIAICGGNLTITAGTDGIQASNTTEAEKGWISIDGGTLNIVSANDGLQAESTLQITDGTLAVTSGGGSENASSKQNGSWGMWGGNQTNQTTTDDTASDSAKGLKSNNALYVTGGSITIDASDDTLHCGTDLTLAGGTLTLSSGDDGIHADHIVSILGGKIDILKSYEGIEGSAIEVSGGTIELVANDDGLNAAGGSDSSSVNGRPGANEFSADSSIYIKISGGTLLINAAGDGIDANGNIYVSGGYTTVYGPTDNGNGAFDYNGVADISGGLVTMAGSSGMAQSFTDTSTQNSIAVYYTSAQSANTTVTLADSSGNTVATFTPKKDYSWVCISAPEIAVNSTYTLYSNSTQLCTITPEKVVTSISSDGSAASGGMMGGMMGGKGNRGDMPADGTFPDMPSDGTAPQMPTDGTMPTDRPQGGNRQNMVAPDANAGATVTPESAVTQ
ncbi:MAG: carbohydrate-binding domain-containing protein [Oscillospiraceae bacterium]|nr:carbohydrate-binding domain-containing protein [Oscillospiraceae bacterium]